MKRIDSLKIDTCNGGQANTKTNNIISTFVTLLEPNIIAIERR